jgi:hypothetical protein
MFEYKLCDLQLLKIKITKNPYKEVEKGPWNYKVIVIFDKLIAFVSRPRDHD